MREIPASHVVNSPSTLAILPEMDNAIPGEGRATLQATSIADFSTLRTLGEGGTARVVLVRHTASSRLLALKKSERARDGVIQHARAEIAALQAVKASGAPFLSRMLCAFEDDEFIHLALVGFSVFLGYYCPCSSWSQEFCPGGDLLTHLARDHRLQPALARFYAGEIVRCRPTR
jgi:serine/threonine protein kinase